MYKTSHLLTYLRLGRPVFIGDYLLWQPAIVAVIFYFAIIVNYLGTW